MNAPLPEHIRKALETVTLDDKYTLDDGRAFMSGVQALVRCPCCSASATRRQGKHGGLHQRLPRQPAGHLRPGAVGGQEAPGAEHRLPARRERRAGATALWGTQQLGFVPRHQQVRRRVRHLVRQGPGRGPLLGRVQARQHGGHHALGGVIAMAGDDHISKSSTAAHQSDHIFKACGTPVFFPSSVQEILDMGLHAFAMSRFSACGRA
jgi:indolepyruvate ferredoxin oxidoreductase